MQERARHGLRRCSFCGISERAAEVLCAGAGAYICPACVQGCVAVLAGLRRKRSELIGPTPSRLVSALNEHVIGQHEAKRALAVAVYNHYKRVAAVAANRSGVQVAKSNVLLIGPTGSGKTLLAQTLARTMDVPLAIVDVTPITQAGYSGEDVESIIDRLLDAAGGDRQRAESGIIFLDEVDKLARRGGPGVRSFDVSGEGVQQSLLKILEGSVVKITDRTKRPPAGSGQMPIDTTHVLFIAGGAFPELDEITSLRQRTNSFGFAAGIAGGEFQVDAAAPTTDDLVEFGLLPEFTGRFPVIVRLDALGPADLQRILTEPRNSLVRQYQELFAADGHTLDFEFDALSIIAQTAHSMGTGARGLRTILEVLLRDLMFDAPDVEAGEKIVITAKRVTEKLRVEESIRTVDAPQGIALRADSEGTSRDDGRPPVAVPKTRDRDS